MRTRCIGIAISAGFAGSAMAQMSSLGAAGGIVPTMRASEPGRHVGPRGPVVASLTYDGVENYGFSGQDFESVFDLYDTWCCERFSIAADAALTEFRTVGFGNGNPFGMTDMLAHIYHAVDEADICDDRDLPTPFMISTPGAGFYDGVAGVTDFGGQCLPAGEYILLWAGQLEFGINGRVFWFGQAGAHDNGGGTADDGFQSNPGNAFGMGECFDTISGSTLLPTGINFVLSGQAGNCGGCPDVDACGDWDDDGDSDADDFFAFLDEFAIGGDCADLDRDGDTDSLDFFFFLDRFVSPC